VSELLQFFAYEHLPPHLQAVSKPFGELARIVEGGTTPSLAELRKTISWIDGALPDNAEAVVAKAKLYEAERLLDEAMRKVLESKDAAVRSLVFKS
jgi:hypothetical protein